MRTLAIVIVLAACSVLIVLASRARAHSFYDQECCSGQDCAPVEKVEYVAGALYNGPPGQVDPLPVMVVTTRHGMAAVPRNMKVRPSPDGRLHACILNGRLICIYVPPNS